MLLRKLNSDEIQNPQARPNQTLVDHVCNMINQLPEIWHKSKPTLQEIVKTTSIDNELLQKILYKAVAIIILTHDFGKLAPAFQIKLKESISKKDRIYSYHYETSAIFSKIVFLNVIKNQHHELVGNDFFKNLSTIIYYLVLAHHQSVLKNHPEDILSSVDIQRIRRIFSMIFNEYTKDGILNQYQKILRKMKAKENQFLKLRIVKEALIELKRLIKTEESLRDFLDDVDEDFCELGLENEDKEIAAEVFLLIEYLFSILCDLDEWDAKFYQENAKSITVTVDEERKEYSRKIINEYRERRLPDWKNTIEIMSQVRNLTYTITDTIETNSLINQIKTLTAPTGSAKTLALLNLAFKLRNDYQTTKNIIPKIIYCLPFITIADQVAEEMSNILQQKHLDYHTPALTVHHNLAPINWNELEEPDTLNKITRIKNRYYVKLWRSDVIITTFVRFWDSLLSCKKSEILRMHRIANSIIIFDEVQAIPIKYWGIIYQAMKLLTKNYGCTIITATATQPLIIPPAEKEDLIENEPIARELYNRLNRYSISYFDQQIKLTDFIVDIITPKLSNETPENIMLVLNTKRSATQVAVTLYEYIRQEKLPYQLYFLSRNVVPADRTVILEEIRKNLKNKKSRQKCLLICTQIVEAGVDISFDCIYRDIAPLSSIIQIAGRCNRGMEKKTIGRVNVFCLEESDKEKLFSDYIYDKIELKKTKIFLRKDEKYQEKAGCYLWNEVEIRDLCARYYHEISQDKITTESLKHLYQLEFESLNESFQLIKELPEKTIFVIRNNEARNIIRKIIEEKEQCKSIPKRFYQYTIDVSIKDLNKIVDSLQPFPDEKKPKFWILESDYYYSTIWGLNPDK